MATEVAGSPEFQACKGSQANRLRYVYMDVLYERHMQDILSIL